MVDHPDYYQPELVEAARRELRQRGVAASVSPVSTGPVSAATLTAEPVRSGLSVVLIVMVTAAVFAVSLGVFYFVKQKNSPATETTAAPKPVRKAPPQLTEVTTSVIPSYDVEALVSQQLKRVPAAERESAASAGQPLRQYRELVKRFWTAETQTEYLTSQAHAGLAGPVFAEQTLLVRQTWSDWNKAAVYSYRFGPAMQAHFKDMQSIANGQQHILEMMPDLLTNNKLQTNKELTDRETDVESGLSGLLPKSPVTGRVYKVPVLTIRL